MKKILFILPFLLTGCFKPTEIINSVIDDAEASTFRSEAQIIINDVEATCLMNSLNIQMGKGEVELSEICEDKTIDMTTFGTYFEQFSDGVTADSITIKNDKIFSTTFYKDDMKIEIINNVIGEVTNK